MSNYFALDQLAKSHQHELRQEAKYAAQLREMVADSRTPFVRSHWKWAVAVGVTILITVLTALSAGAAV